MGTQQYFASGVLRVPIVSSFLHGYSISFKVIFEGDLDERNWVWDFGHAKRSKYLIDGKNPKEWMDYMFDHSTIIAEDDPYLENFKQMDKDGIIQLRIIPSTGCEKFAEYIYTKLNSWVEYESNGRVKIIQVEVKEHEKNSAIYIPSKNTLKAKSKVPTF
jgi:6-pyruvoyltetrahydropterin/6-carboxytetrahydropterin synthase